MLGTKWEKKVIYLQNMFVKTCLAMNWMYSWFCDDDVWKRTFAFARNRTSLWESVRVQLDWRRVRCRDNILCGLLMHSIHWSEHVSLWGQSSGETVLSSIEFSGSNQVVSEIVNSFHWNICQKYKSTCVIFDGCDYR